MAGARGAGSCTLGWCTGGGGSSQCRGAHKEQEAKREGHEFNKRLECGASAALAQGKWRRRGSGGSQCRGWPASPATWRAAERPRGRPRYCSPLRPPPGRRETHTVPTEQSKQSKHSVIKSTSLVRWGWTQNKTCRPCLSAAPLEHDRYAPFLFSTGAVASHRPCMCV